MSMPVAPVGGSWARSSTRVCSTRAFLSKETQPRVMSSAGWLGSGVATATAFASPAGSLKLASTLHAIFGGRTTWGLSFLPVVSE